MQKNNELNWRTKYDTQTKVNQLAYEIVGSAIEVHKIMKPGLLESVYEACLHRELTLRGYKVKRQGKVEIDYKGFHIDSDYRFDLLVEDCVVVELKATENMHPIYDAQVMSHMRLLKKPKGLLINFHVEKLTEGLTPFVNVFFAMLPK